MFCGKCGTKLKNDKCPKCDKKEEKKTEKVKVEKVKEVKEDENASFGWAALGFFVPIVGLILFFVFMNSNKKVSKLSGIGALVGFCTKVFIYIVYYVVSFVGLYSGIMGFYNSIMEKPIYEYSPYNHSIISGSNTKTIEMDDINTDKKLDELDFKLNDFTQMLNGKEYELGTEYYTVMLYNNKLTFRDGDEIIKELDNVTMAFYYQVDCSSKDVLLIRMNNKDYYINGLTDNIDFKEVSSTYDKYYVVNNHTLTCGASTLVVGKASDGKIYDLNGEVGIETKNLYYYDDPDNWIGTTRGYKIANKYGNVKLVIMDSVVDELNSFIDVSGNAYKYTYSSNGESSLELIENSLVDKVEYDEDDSKVVLFFENGEEYTFNFSRVDY